MLAWSVEKATWPSWLANWRRLLVVGGRPIRRGSQPCAGRRHWFRVMRQWCWRRPEASAWSVGERLVGVDVYCTVADAKLRARALRAGPAVEMAVADRGKALAGQEVAVAAAREALRRASEELVLFGLLGATAGGTELVELRRLARRPRH